MRINATIAILSIISAGTMHADEAAQPLYYEDYLNALSGSTASAVEVVPAEPAAEETILSAADEFRYYEDYINSISGEYEQTPAATEIAETGKVGDELIAESRQGGSSALSQALAASTVSSQIDMSKLSEAFGNFLGKNLKNSGIEFEVEPLFTGIRNGLSDQPSPLSESEYEAMMIAVQQQAYEKVSSTNLAKAAAFMAENSRNPKVVELVPGKLQYEVLKQGTGAVVKSENTPLINYTGKFVDGTVFSSSEETGGAITIPLSHTISGFQKGIAGMHEGEKRRLFIHPEEGYGATAGHLPPNSLLIFDIEVVTANNEEDEVDDIDDSDVEPSDEDVDNSDVEDEEPDRMQK